jgi:hypothetical protein
MTYNFKDHKNGDTFPGVQFELKVNDVAKSLEGAKIDMNVDGTIFSTNTGELEITSAASGIWQFKSQVVSFPVKKLAVPPYISPYYTYPYEMIITFGDGSVKTYIDGTWKIVE